MLVPCHCVILDIEETTYSKDLILDAISQNDVIKGGNWNICKKNIHELWRLTLINKKVLPLWHSFIAFEHHYNLPNLSIQN